jgi:phosphatidylserine/phosphatidylglycerophosphate/cardiolipin synthase-like enzyme
MKVLAAVLSPLLLVAIILSSSLSYSSEPALQHEPDSHTWAVYFSPDGGATRAVVEALGRAKASVLVQAYTFTSAPIAKDLVKAHKRGVRVWQADRRIR